MSSDKRNIDISNIDIFILIQNVPEDMKEICPGNSKSFLKVINKRILFYQLEFFERQGIKKVNLLINSDVRVASDLYLKEYKGIEINQIPFDANKDIYYLFGKIKEHLTKKNFILVEGDSIFSFDFWEFVDNHIDNKNLISLILQKKNLTQTKLPFLKKKNLDIFAISSEDNRVLFHAQKENDSENNDNLFLPKNILSHCTNMKLLFNYINSGFYIINKSIFDLIESDVFKNDNAKEEKKETTSIENKLIFYLVKKSFSKKLNMILINKMNNLKEKEKDNKNEKLLSLLAKRIIIKAKIIENNRENLNSDFYLKVIDYPTYFSTIDEIQTSYEKILPIFFQTENNNKNYFMNFADEIAENMNNNKMFNDNIEKLECISFDSYIAIGEKSELIKIEKGSRVNRTVAGVDLSVKEGAKITACLIGDGVEIGSDCKITNCIIGDGVVIEKNCIISDCVVENGYKIQKVVNISKKILSKEKDDEVYEINN